MYFISYGRKPISDTTHTVTLENGHVKRKSDLNFKKNQPFVPSKFTKVPIILVNNTKLVGKRKRISPTKRKGSNKAGPTLPSRPSGSTLTKRRKTNVPGIKGFCYVKSVLISSLALDH